MRSLVYCLLFFISAPSYGVIGGINLTETMPPQLCQIVPISAKGAYLSQFACSAVVIGKNKILTAGHCAYFKEAPLRVDCVSGDQFTVDLNQSADNFDPQGAWNPQISVDDSIRLQRDLAVIEVNGEFSVPALPVEIRPQDWSNVGNHCYFLATGTDEYGRWGYAQFKKVDSANILVRLQDSNLISLTGHPQVSGHDSGGAFVCGNDVNDLRVVGTIVGQWKGRESIIATYTTDESSQWLTDQLRLEDKNSEHKIKACDDSAIFLNSENFEATISHLEGFEEIRQYLMLEIERGHKVCANTSVLEKNNYQYFKNFLTFQITNGFSGVTKTLAVLFQNSSIQAHHNVGRRPWVVLEGSFVKKHLSQLVSNFTPILDVKIHNNDLTPLFSSSLFSGFKLIQPSIVPLTQLSDHSQSYYLMTWLKDVTTGADIYTQILAPQMAILKYEEASQTLQVGEIQAAFDKLLLPLEQNLKETQKRALQKKTLSEKIDFINSLVD